MKPIEMLLQTVAKLRDPENGCPWDIEQTHLSLADCLIEETCELLQTIDQNDFSHMCEELGDVLLQVVMHAQIAHEAGFFHFDDVALSINDKLIRRHPHVFNNKAKIDKKTVLQQWDEIKATEKSSSPKPEAEFQSIPPALPALLFARSVYKKLQKNNQLHLSGVLPDQTDVPFTDEDAGVALFALVARCRHNGIDPEGALRRYSQSIIKDLVSNIFTN
jgi:ATP diphosphatase